MTTRMRIICAASAALCLTACQSSQGADWGSLKGKFVYKGTAKAPPLKITKDVEFCSEYDLVNETLTVGEEGALENAFVYLYLGRRDTVDVHPDYEKEDFKPAVLDNKGCRFEPHAMVLWTKQPLEIKNSDEGIGHNTNAQKLVANPKFNEQVTNDRPITKEFTKSEPIPTEVACNVHPWMNGFVLIRDNPYMAVSGKDGTFEIKNLPAGKHEFVIWHEAKGNVRDLEIGGEETDRRGRVEFEIPAGKTLDLGEIVVTPDLLDQ